MEKARVKKVIIVILFLFTFSVTGVYAGDTLRASKIIFTLDSLFDANSQPVGESLISQLRSESEKNNFRRGELKAMEFSSRLLRKKWKYKEAIANDLKLIAKLDSVKESVMLALAFKRIGRNYTEIGEYKSAISSFTKAYNLNLNIGNKQEQAILIFLMGGVHERNESFAQALKSYSDSKKVYESIPDSGYIIMCLQAIGNIYSRMEKYDLGVNYLIKARDLSRYRKDEEVLLTSLNNLGIVYKKQGNYTEALKCYSECLILAQKYYPDDESIPTVEVNMGNIYVLQKDFAKAEYYIKRSMEKFKKLKFLTGLMESCLSLSELEEARGNFKESLIMFKQHKLYFDSLTNIEKTAAINELQSKFDLDRKNREIEILNNQAQLKEKELYTNKLIRNGSIAGTFIVLVFAFILLANYRKKNAINRLLKEQNQRILDEQNKSENLLLNILPYETAQELKNKGQADARKYQRVTVMFTDFVNFTHITEQLEAEALVKEIHVLFSYFDEIMERLGIEKIKTIGDAYMCAAGIPKQIENDAELVVKAAIEIQKYISEQKLLREKDGRPVWDIRIGIHTGPVVAGIVGKKKFAYDIWGDTVNIASRMETSSQAGKINISETTYNQIKNIFTCINRGSIEVKNKGKVEMYFVEV